MKKIIFYFLLFVPFFMIGQNMSEYEYDKYTHVFWLSNDSIYFDGPSPIKADNLFIDVSLGDRHASVFIKNNADNPIYIKWNHVTVIGDKSYMGDNFILLDPQEIKDRTKKEQIEYCAKGDYCSQRFYPLLGEKIFDERKAKKLLKETKKDVVLQYEITIPIIYNDEVLKLIVIKRGIYNGKKG